ncbi:MAG: efflux RND transporter permease subunit [Rickettsiaceae bacterium]|nr:efflux RND transporter permease subunit [Rickettsiaceae bacterium]
MQLSEICVKKPVFTTVLSLIIVAVGIIFFTKLELRDVPNIAPPIITVTSTYPGADADYMERQITQRIERELKSTKNLDTLTSTSAEGISEIILVMKLDSDQEVALSDVRSKISGLSQKLPDDMTLPSVEKMDSDARPSLWIAVNSNIYDDLELTRITENQIKAVLEKLSTVGRAIVFGARDYTMTIEPINKSLLQYQISPLDLEQAIYTQNRDYPAGTIKTTTQNFSIKLAGALNKIEDFQNIILKRNNDGTLLKLSKVANVNLKSKETDVFLRYNSKPSIALGLVKQSTANIIELSDAVQQILPHIVKNLPAGIEVTIAYDAALPVNKSIDAVYWTIFEAVILVSLIIYLFLGSLKISLIPLVTIPISLIGTFFVMYQLGYSINNFTLLAMILAIGLVVDDAIVMMENIYRHIHQLGKNPIQAAIDGSREISFAVIAMTITLSSVFFPVGFIDGFLGKLFIEFAWTLAFCVLFSGFVALTLTPMMCARMISNDSIEHYAFLQYFENFIEKIKGHYIHLLEKLFQAKTQFVIICISSILLLTLMLIIVPKTFVPEEDQGFLIGFFKGYEGSNVQSSLATVIEAEKVLDTIPEIYGYFDVTGYGSAEEAIAFIPLKNWDKRSRSQRQIQDELNMRLAQIPGMTIFTIAPPSLGGSRGDKSVEFYITSTGEYSEIDIISQKFLEEMNKSSILVDSEREFKAFTPTLNIVVDREKAYRYEVSLNNIGYTIQYLVAGKTVGDFRIGTDIYDVIIKYNIDQRNKVDDLSNILLKNAKGKMLPLLSVADILDTSSIKQYNHYNANRAVKLTANLASTKTLTDAVKELNLIASKVINDGKMQLQYEGQIKQMQESSGDTILVFIFALLFIFLVLAAQFESFNNSLLILVAVPFSMTGGLIGLWIFGNSLNMYSNIGLITLIGLVTKNSIMIVEFIQQLHTAGKKINDAIIEAAQLRFRPILMTTIATICGAIPLVLASGAGAAARNSIGLVIVWGIMIGTSFTLFVIPTLYYMIRGEK